MPQCGSRMLLHVLLEWFFLIFMVKPTSNASSAGSSARHITVKKHQSTNKANAKRRSHAVVSTAAISHGMVWYGMVWYGMVWHLSVMDAERKNKINHANYHLIDTPPAPHQAPNHTTVLYGMGPSNPPSCCTCSPPDSMEC